MWIREWDCNWDARCKMGQGRRVQNREWNWDGGTSHKIGTGIGTGS